MRLRSSTRCFHALILSLLLPIGIAIGCSSFQAARLYQSGTAELQRGDYEQAILDLEHAAALEPRASEIQNHLGLALVGAGREGEAERAFQRALDLDCDNAAAAENLALVASGDDGDDADEGAAGSKEPRASAQGKHGAAATTRARPQKQP